MGERNMWRVSGGWSKILHVVGGIMQYSVTHPGKRVRKRYYMRKGRGVYSDSSVSPPYYVLYFISSSVEWSYSVQS